MPQKLKIHNTFGLCYENGSAQYPIQNAEIKIIMEYILAFVMRTILPNTQIQNAETKIIMEHIKCHVLQLKCHFTI